MKEKYHCPFEALIELVGGRWKMLILWRLNLHDFLGFDELQKLTEKAVPEELEKDLIELERDGFVQKITYPEIPPRVEYHITELGRSLWPVLISMQEWSIEYLQERDAEIDEKVLEEFYTVKKDHHIDDIVSGKIGEAEL